MSQPRCTLPPAVPLRDSGLHESEDTWPTPGRLSTGQACEEDGGIEILLQDIAQTPTREVRCSGPSVEQDVDEVTSPRKDGFVEVGADTGGAAFPLPALSPDLYDLPPLNVPAIEEPPASCNTSLQDRYRSGGWECAIRPAGV